VAITRAKGMLILVGCAAALRRDPVWKALIDSLTTQGLIFTFTVTV